MESPYLFTYIIGYRHNPERVNNLKRVLDWLNSFKGIEIIIVEQDKSQNLPNLTLSGFKYIFTKSHLPYNRSWAFNVGLKNSTTNAIVFGDSDLIMDRMEFINSLNMLNQYECVSPYNSVLDLEPNESLMPIESISGIRRAGRGENDNQKINLCGGIVIYRRDSIFKIGGWCERFFGWGGEDNYQEFKTKGLLSWYEKPGKCYHLWHKRLPPDPKFYNKTLEMLNKLMGMSMDDTKRLIHADMPKIGLKNKLS